MFDDCGKLKVSESKYNHFVSVGSFFGKRWKQKVIEENGELVTILHGPREREDTEKDKE